MSKPLGVTGSTGRLGGRIARLLSADGVPQRLVVRDPLRAPSLPEASVAQASYDDVAAVRRALAGCDTALMVSGSESATRLEEHIEASGMTWTFLRDNLYIDFFPFGHRGQTYSLTGPEAISMAEAAALMSEDLGKRFSYHDETLDEAYRSRASYGAPAWQGDAWVSTYTAIAAGELAGVTDDVRRLTGHEPRSLSDLLASARR